MARTTKKTTKTVETKVAAPVVETVAEAAAVETPVVEAAEVTEAPVVEKEVKKAPAKKTTAKKATVKEEVKAEETTKEVVLKANVTLQFAEESLTAIAKDVWVYDLNKDVTELKTVELYVKPEEGLCYYVFNGDVTGNFVI